MKKIVIVIPTFNRKKQLKILLNQIYSQVCDHDVHVEIVVVVDGSTDGTNNMLETNFPKVCTVNGTGNWWFTKSLNEGISVALKLLPDFILTMNDDSEINNNFLTNIITASLSVTPFSLIGAISISKKSPLKVSFSGIYKISKWRYKTFPYIKKTTIVDFNQLNGIYPSLTLMTRGLLIPITVIKAIGLFDEKFPQYGSDEDFVLRAFYNGINAFVCFDAVIYDNQELTSLGSPFNRPKLVELLKSFLNKYTVNSIAKAIKYFIRHGKPVFLPLYIFIYFSQVFYTRYIKYK